jgi:hypothetical protein
VETKNRTQKQGCKNAILENRRHFAIYNKKRKEPCPPYVGGTGVLEHTKKQLCKICRFNKITVLRLFLIDVRENLATLECGHKGLEVPLIKVAVHATQRFIGGANYGK